MANPLSRSARRMHAALLLPALAVLAGMTACSKEPEIPAISAAAHRDTLAKWQASRTAWLKIPGRPVSYTGLVWISQGSNTIGSDSTSTVKLVGREVPALVGTLLREGNSVRFEPANAEVAALTRIDSVPATVRELRSDVDKGGPSRVEVGSAGFRIVRRVDSVGVRMWDADLASAERIAERIAPLTYFPLDPAWRAGGRLIPAAKPETIAVPTTAGVGEIHIVLGAVEFELGGKAQRLTAFAGANARDLYFSFSDETSGEETYGFRFLHAAFDTLSKAVVMDFNFAYNPDCAFSSFTTCPLPPQENRLPVRVTAGEKTAVHLVGAPGPHATTRK